MREEELQPHNRRSTVLWVGFWFVFLSTPVAACFAPALAEAVPMLSFLSTVSRILWTGAATLVGGGFVCGFIYARILSETDEDFILRGIRCGFFLSGTYFALLLFFFALMQHV